MRATGFVARAVATGLGAFVVFVAANFVGPGWYEDLVRRLQPATRSVAPPPTPGARSGPIGPPVSVTPMRPEGNDSSVSPVPLPLTLVRTQRGRNSREGFAQIGVIAHSPQTYTAGALLANGARLAEIYDHYVVLERDGHTARLYLQGQEHGGPGVARALLSVGGTAEATSSVAESRDELTDYLRPSPIFIGNELHGYALYAGRKASPFSQFGLQPGDVLTHINGTAVSDASDSLTALHRLIDGEALTVEVERQGIPQTLSLDGSSLTRAAPTEPEVTPAINTTTRQAVSSVALRSLRPPEDRP
jgi:membrane-associated protease RseP (regulator of RpoE activity)